jgi:(1->4)-alpha-D-glucan 1-alpha-D-glucosylmutase
VRPILSTYRLQLHSGFRLADVGNLVPYFAALGVTHLHCSPLLAARRGSLHGYDVADPTRLNPDLGTEDELRALADTMHRAGLGLVLDVVPNHMAASAESPFWVDVLTHGSGSPFARWFDIEWRSGGPSSRPRIVLPVLGDLRVHAIERGELRIELGDGRMHVAYHEHEWPLDPLSLHAVLPMVADDAEETGVAPELVASVRAHGRMLRALARRRVRTQSAREDLARRASDAAARIEDLLRSERPLEAAAERAVAAFGAGPEGPRRLRRLLDAQRYRLVFWRREARELNYRRFFDVNELVALHMEDPEVFERTHAKVLEWRREGIIDGFRIDHPDGLLDPLGYLRRLADEAFEWRADARYPVWVEKILMPGEQLPAVWPVAGTTGYDFLNQVEQLFVHPGGFAQVERDYAHLIRRRLSVALAAEAGKREALGGGLSPGVRLLAIRLMRLAEGAQPPLTLNAARSALIEVITALPVYRTYIDRHLPTGGADDRRLLEEAVTAARARGRAAPAALDLLHAVLLGAPGEAAEREQLRLRFIQRFQQLSGPAMAKGVEDTAFYAWVPLASLNEVGGAPELAPDATAALHGAAAARAVSWPGAMLSVTTHDTKRSADLRARLDLLSEWPDEWEERVYRWRRLTRPLQRRTEHGNAPDVATLYLFFQSLLGVWPVGDVVDARCLDTLTRRLQQYMLKAVREAKRRTSWLEPDALYESALADYITGALDPSRSADFLADVAAFAARVAEGGWWNSIARTVLQLTSPGVPDVYQGDELWNLALVDPDNRRPVDFERRRRLLNEAALADPGGVGRSFLDALVSSPEDGRLKLHVIHRLLHARRHAPALFVGADYQPLTAAGEHARETVAFARRAGESLMIVVVPRLTSAAGAASGRPVGPPVGPAFWGDTSLPVPPGWERAPFTCALSGTEVLPTDGTVRVAETFARLPAAVLLAGGG